MLNILTKIQTWLVVSIFAATTIYAQNGKNKNTAQSPERGHEMSETQIMPAYGAPALIDVRNSWDFYATGSFIYWQARQENMEIGLISRNNPEAGAPNPFRTSFVNNMSVTSPNFTFRPGFKLGIGARLDWDGWDAFLEYTQFHGRTASGVRPLARSTTGPSSDHPNGEYLYPILGNPESNVRVGLSPPSPLFFQNANQSWVLKMDFLDLSLARAYYSGTKLTIRPFFGARGAWIRQNLTTGYNGSPGYASNLGQRNTKVTNFYSSWGVGPRTGFESNWMIGKGLRLIGNGATDILYTRYSLHSGQQTYDSDVPPFVLPSPIESNYSVSQEIDYLRAHIDLEMGFGWGTYFYHNDYHVDLSATYGFQVFWSQNMFRNFEDNGSAGTSFAPSGDLFVHGLTMTARFDF